MVKAKSVPGVIGSRGRRQEACLSAVSLAEGKHAHDIMERHKYLFESFFLVLASYLEPAALSSACLSSPACQHRRPCREDQSLASRLQANQCREPCRKSKPRPISARRRAAISIAVEVAAVNANGGDRVK